MAPCMFIVTPTWWLFPLLPLATVLGPTLPASGLRLRVAPDGVPDQSSAVVCLDDGQGGDASLLCFVALRRRGVLLGLYSFPGVTTLGLQITAQSATASRQLVADRKLVPSWAWVHREDGHHHRSTLPGGAVYQFALHGVAARQLGSVAVNVRLGRLHFLVKGAPTISNCPGDALWLGTRRCFAAQQAHRALYAGLTVAALDASFAVAGAMAARRVWVDVQTAGTLTPAEKESIHVLHAQLDRPEGSDAFLLAFRPNPSQWASAHALHPHMSDMGSFIGPSEFHTRGIVLPIAVGVVDNGGNPLKPSRVPTVSLAWVLAALLGNRGVELLEVRTSMDGWPEALESLLTGGDRLQKVACICMPGAPGTLLTRAAAARGIALVPQEPPTLATLGAPCFRTGAIHQQSHPAFAVSSLLALDKSSAYGIQMQASVAVAPLDEFGHLVIPANVRIWIEVGCNNWEMLHDDLSRFSDVYLITFEPLVDKFVYVRTLAQGHGRHVVLPFAIAPVSVGHFAALRSQNYTNFQGTAGRRFQESGASSLLHYSPGFQDHRWPGAASQYKFFREYLVPAVPLEWVVGDLLGGKEIDFLKVDAQGLDFGVFASLGRHTRRVHRAQLELHTHVRHAGEVACPDVVAKMAAVHGFHVVRGQCATFNPSWHDEADIVFERF